MWILLASIFALLYASASLAYAIKVDRHWQRIEKRRQDEFNHLVDVGRGGL